MPHLRMVDDALWYRANAAIDAAPQTQPRQGRDNPLYGIPRDSRGPLAGILLCRCGNKMRPEAGSQNAYRCRLAQAGGCWIKATSPRDKTHQWIAEAVLAQLQSLEGRIDQLIEDAMALLADAGRRAARKVRLEEKRAETRSDSGAVGTGYIATDAPGLKVRTKFGEIGTAHDRDHASDEGARVGGRNPIQAGILAWRQPVCQYQRVVRRKFVATTGDMACGCCPNYDLRRIKASRSRVWARTPHIRSLISDGHKTTSDSAAAYAGRRRPWLRRGSTWLAQACRSRTMSPTRRSSPESTAGSWPAGRALESVAFLPLIFGFTASWPPSACETGEDKSRKRSWSSIVGVV